MQDPAASPSDSTFWTRYRRWKHAVGFPLVILALFLMKEQPEMAPLWFTGLAIAGFLVIAYLGEEIFWIAQRRGRPCSSCGEKVQLRPFSLRTRCPHCGQEF